MDQTEGSNKEVLLPSTQKPKSNFLIIILIIVGLLLTASLIYLGYRLSHVQKERATPLPKPQKSPSIQADVTTNWETYTNNDYNFEFKYPPKFTTTAKSADNQIIALMDDSNTKSRLSTLPDIFIRILPLESEQDYKSVLVNDVVFDGSGSHPGSFEEFSSKVINNNTVYFIQTGNFEGILTYNYYLINRKNIITFTVTSSPIDWTNPDYKAENDPLNQNFQQILSTFKFLDLSQKVDETPSLTLNNIPILPTKDWKQVRQNGVSYKVPKDAKCLSSVSPEKIDESNCRYVYISKEQIMPMSIFVTEYKGGSRRDQFFGDNNTDCHWLIEEAVFGNIKALQIAIDSGWCQGGGGGIVAIVGNKFVEFYESGYTYSTKEILRWNVRDTIVSTLKLD